MGHNHADSMLNLKRGSPEHCSINSGWSNSSVHYMINLVALQTENFTKSTPNLVKEHHGFESILARVRIVVLASGYYDWVKIIMTKFSCIVTWDVWVVTKHSSIRVPFSHCWAVCCDSLLWMSPNLWAEAFWNFNSKPKNSGIKKTYFSFEASDGLTEYCLMASFLRRFGALVLWAMALIPQRTESVWNNLTLS